MNTASNLPAPILTDTYLRLAVAAYLARYKGDSRTHTPRTCAPSSNGAPATSSRRWQHSAHTSSSPGDPTDDTEVPDSFSIVRPSTGNSDFSDVDFCDILREFTAAP